MSSVWIAGFHDDVESQSVSGSWCCGLNAIDGANLRQQATLQTETNAAAARAFALFWDGLRFFEAVPIHVRLGESLWFSGSSHLGCLTEKEISGT